jgi:hypothetical protein
MVALPARLQFSSFEHSRRKDQHPAKSNRLTLFNIKNCVEQFDLFILSVLGFALFTNESAPRMMGMRLKQLVRGI